jgi:hypothetical protein
MTALRTDFEMHAIWQGYVEDLAAKDFEARKARTSFERRVRNLTINLIHEGESLGDSISELYCSLAGLMSCKKVSV